MVLVNYLSNEYLFIFVFLVITTLISSVALGLSYGVVYQDNYFEKISVYECGFEPFEDTRVKFDVRFYLVSILFIIFDIEIMFLFPWAICINRLPFFATFNMFIFLIILTIGFIYEWKKGALDWS